MNLALHLNLSISDRAIASVAVQRGWKLNQFGDNPGIGWDGFNPHAPIRYYGNTPVRSFSRRKLMIHFHEVHPVTLSSISWITHRDITLMKLLDLPQPLTERLFVKPVSGKWFKSRVYCSGETISPSEAKLASADPQAQFVYVSRPVYFITEVRCWCVDGRILTYSVYRGQMDTDIAPLVTLVKDLYDKCSVLPRAVVADFGWRTDLGKWSLVELNRPWAADVYQADPARCLDCVVASQSQGGS